ncbi:MAG: hypothetical protein GF372_00430 [Candidatus Marinimicrobia bacterium]|nr:hypothetical protein [Candidatus Neomarinimicrobiota bacterium]
MISAIRTYPVPVHFVNGRQHLQIRELCGTDEQAVAGTSTGDAIDLIQGLVVIENPAEFSASHLVPTDRDVILSAIYERTYGSRIQGTMDCPECRAQYDFDFRLDDFREAILSERETPALRFEGSQVFAKADDLEFRLVNGSDELSIRGMDADQASQVLLDRCCQDYDPDSAVDIEKIFARLTPLLRSEVESLCPECDSVHPVQFDMQHYLLSTLIQEQQYLAYEMHRIASAYQWTPAEILDLPRHLRKRYVALIENDIERGLT